MYNFNVITITFTMFWQYRRNSYHFITWIPSCWRRIPALISKLGENCSWTLIFTDPKEEGENKFTAVLLPCRLARLWRADTSDYFCCARWRGSDAGFFFLIHGQHKAKLASDPAISIEVHSWLRPQLSLERYTVRDPSVTSNTNLGTKIPPYNIFLFLCYINLFALSHWFPYCLQ